MSEGDHTAKQEAKRRLSEPEGDHELHSALGHMKEHHPHLWRVLHKVHFAGHVDPSKLDEWRRARRTARNTSWWKITTRPSAI